LSVDYIKKTDLALEMGLGSASLTTKNFVN
jgi:hypothetical protein